MNNLIALINGSLFTLGNVLLFPISGLDTLIQILFISLLIGSLMVIPYGWLSDQDAIRRVKRGIGAGILESVLFRRDPVVSLRAQVRLFLAGVRYLWLALRPVAILAIPIVVVMAHLNIRYGLRGLESGETAILAVKVEQAGDLRHINLSSEPETELTGPVRDISNRTAMWRVRPSEKRSSADLQIAIGDGAPLFSQSLVLAPGVRSAPASLYLSERSWFTSLLQPNGASIQRLPEGPLEEISLSYPERVYTVAGIELSWITIFLLASLLGGIITSRYAGISL